MGWLFGSRSRDRARSGYTQLAPEAPPISAPPKAPARAQPTPQQALDALKAGNEAFLRGENNLGHVKANDLDELQAGQSPIATIVGCADSRTPPTILFNQGFGRLFSIRVAGNTVDRRGLASIVYAVKHLNCPLVVVMGHTGCGAVAAAEAIVDGRADMDPSLEAMIEPIIPAVLAARRARPANPSAAAVEQNARIVAIKLATADTALVQALAAGRLMIVGAVKDMSSGRVRFVEQIGGAAAVATAPRVAELA